MIKEVFQKQILFHDQAKQGRFPLAKIFPRSGKLSTSKEFFHEQGSFLQAKTFPQSRKFSTSRDFSISKEVFHKQSFT